MTGAEFAANLRGWLEVELSGPDEERIARRFDAAMANRPCDQCGARHDIGDFENSRSCYVRAETLKDAIAAMTAERDAALEGQRKADGDYYVVTERERDAARTERDAANAARESQWKELQAARAALARAHAALSHAVAYAPCDCGPPGDVHDDECAHHGADAVLADPTGRAAAEYVAALEREHEAAQLLKVSTRLGDAPAALRFLDAHAAVEALRAVKP